MIVMKILLVLAILTFAVGVASIGMFISDLEDIKAIDKDEIDREFYRRLP